MREFKKLILEIYQHVTKIVKSGAGYCNGIYNFDLKETRIKSTEKQTIHIPDPKLRTTACKLLL